MEVFRPHTEGQHIGIRTGRVVSSSQLNDVALSSGPFLLVLSGALRNLTETGGALSFDSTTVTFDSTETTMDRTE